jgi:hypothetical protein
VPSTSEFAHLISLVLFGAMIPVMHLVLVRRAFTDVTPKWQRVLLLLPPASPVVAWRAGHKKVSALWVVTWVVYGALRAAV